MGWGSATEEQPGWGQSSAPCASTLWHLPEPSPGGQNSGRRDTGTCPLLTPWKTRRGKKGERTGVEGKGCSQSSSEGCGRFWRWEAHPGTGIAEVTSPPFCEEQKHPEKHHKKLSCSSTAPPFHPDSVKFHTHAFFAGGKIFCFFFKEEKGDLGEKKKKN